MSKEKFPGSKEKRKGPKESPKIKIGGEVRKKAEKALKGFPRETLEALKSLDNNETFLNIIKGVNPKFKHAGDVFGLGSEEDFQEVVVTLIAGETGIPAKDLKNFLAAGRKLHPDWFFEEDGETPITDGIKNPGMLAILEERNTAPKEIEEGPVTQAPKAVLPEYRPSQQRLLLLEKIEALPSALRKIAKGYSSFYEAVNDKKGKVYEELLKQWQKLAPILDDSLREEVLLVAGETTQAIVNVLEFHDAKSWSHGMTSVLVFQEFMGYWNIRKAIEDLDSEEVVTVLLVTAMRANPDNARWFVTKMKGGGEVKENTEYDPKIYYLEETFGKKACQTVLAAAHEVLGMKN